MTKHALSASKNPRIWGISPGCQFASENCLQMQSGVHSLFPFAFPPSSLSLSVNLLHWPHNSSPGEKDDTKNACMWCADLVHQIYVSLFRLQKLCGMHLFLALRASVDWVGWKLVELWPHPMSQTLVGLIHRHRVLTINCIQLMEDAAQLQKTKYGNLNFKVKWEGFRWGTGWWG